jgi:hypothetical protein
MIFLAEFDGLKMRRRMNLNHVLSELSLLTRSFHTQQQLDYYCTAIKDMRNLLTLPVFSAMIATLGTKTALAWSVRTCSSHHSQATLRRTLFSPTSLLSFSQRATKPTAFSGALRSFSETATRNDNGDENEAPNENLLIFQPGDKIQVEVISFGPMGASVEIIATSHDPDDLISEDEPPLASGLILQKEIQYFRQARDNVDVVRGEVLPAYVERVREESNRVDVGLRAYGGKAKAEEVSKMILDRLEYSSGGILMIGDKSHPEDINAEFPGVSKSTFKRAVSALYKQGAVLPSASTISLVKQPGGREPQSD